MLSTEPELVTIGDSLQRVAARRVRKQRRARRSLRLAIGALASLLIVSAAAVAGIGPLARVIPGFSSTAEPVVASSTLSPEFGQLADLAQIHPAGPTRFGLTPYITPSLKGGICVMFKSSSRGMTYGGCGTRADVNGYTTDGHIGSGKDAIYVGVRPDGVTSVTADDGTSIPVIDNTYITDKPVTPYAK
jgi:hypothetical protein